MKSGSFQVLACVCVALAACGNTDGATPKCDAGSCFTQPDGGAAVAQDASIDQETGADAAEEAEAKSDAPPPCDTCSIRVETAVWTAYLCADNGPPSSKLLLQTLGACFCKACQTQCTDTCSSKADMPTDECLRCAEKSCPTEWADCIADR